jgi:phosphate:Na+ symporter
MLAFLIGADIGLTALVLLGSIHLDQYGFIPIAVGCVAFQFCSNRTARGIGQVLLSIGFLFYGISTIRDAGTQINPTGDFVQLLAIAEHYPVLLLGIAAVCTVAMQSSTAAILLVISLGSASGFGLSVILPVIAGANLGTGLTMLMLGWKQTPTRRLALSNLLAKAAVAVVVLAAIPFWAGLLGRVPLAAAGQAALGHTAFNVLLALLAFPAIPLLDRLASHLTPGHTDSADQPFGPRHLDPVPPQSLSIGLGHAMREVLHVSEIVRQMMDEVWAGFKAGDLGRVEAVADLDDRVDLLDRAVKRYLVRLIADSGEDDDTGETLKQMRYLTELETIGDIIDKSFSDVIQKKIRRGIDLSARTAGELDDFYAKVYENLVIAETAFHSNDSELAMQLVRHKSRINQRYNILRDRFLDRVRLGQDERLDAGAIYLDLLANLRRINSCVTHIAFVILDIDPTPATAAILQREPAVQPVASPASQG